MSEEILERLMPDPSYGSVAKKERLLALATEHGVVRISAEKGIGVDGAIQFIEAYHGRMKQAAFPEEHFSALK